MYFGKQIGRGKKIGGILIAVSLVMSWIAYQEFYLNGSKGLGTDKSPLALQPACAIALVPHIGGGGIDRQIVRLQNQLQSGEFRPDYLEHLAWAYVAKARSDFDPGFYSMAQATAGCIAKLEPNAPSALLLKAHIYNNMHKFQQAESTGRLLIAKRGAWFDYAVFGDALMEQGKLEEAVVAYQKMMGIRPGPQAYLRAAHVRWLTGDLTGAIELVKLAIPAASRLDWETAAWVNVRLAAYLNQAGQVEKSMAYLKKALAFQDDYPPALLALGRMYLAQNQVEEAVYTLRKAVDGNPLPEYQWALIEALKVSGHRSELERRQAILRGRGAVEDRRTYALYLASTGEGDPSLLNLAEKEIEVRRDVLTLDTLAWVLYSQGDYKNAMYFSKKAMAQGTRDARLFYHWGTIAAANQKFDEAKRWLDQAYVLRRMLLPSEQSRLFHEIEVIQSNWSAVALKSALDRKTNLI